MKTGNVRGGIENELTGGMFALEFHNKVALSQKRFVFVDIW
jgi:hypothetical protein